MAQDKMRMQWRYVPLDTPISLIMYPINQEHCRMFWGRWLLIDCIMQFGEKKVKNFELLIPHRRFMREVKSMPVADQDRLKYHTNEIVLTKHKQDKMSIVLKDEIVYTK